MIRHSIILNLLVVAVVGIFLCGNSVDALNPKIEEDDVWIKLSRLADVKDLVDNGDVEGAKLVIDTFSEEFPEYITDDISSEGVKGGRVEIDNNILVDLKERWKKYLSVRQRQGVLKEAPAKKRNRSPWVETTRSQRNALVNILPRGRGSYM